MSSAQAQLAPDSARLVVKLPVVPLFNCTYGLEGEYRLAKRWSISLGGRGIAGTVPTSVSSNANADNDQVRGYGFGGGLRYYIPKTGADGAKLAGLYLGLKADYQHLILGSQREAWGEDLATDGLRYYTYRSRDFEETINRVGGAVTLGYQCQIFHPRLRADFFASLNRLDSKSSAGDATRYRSSSTDYGYSAAFWSLGFSVGFVIK